MSNEETVRAVERLVEWTNAGQRYVTTLTRSKEEVFIVVEDSTSAGLGTYRGRGDNFAEAVNEALDNHKNRLLGVR